jgi:hypothetical protein
MQHVMSFMAIEHVFNEKNIGRDREAANGKLLCSHNRVFVWGLSC